MKLGGDAAAVLPYLVAALVAATLLAFGLTPLVRRFAMARGLVDEPNARRINVRPIPRGGGLAVAIAFIAVGGGLMLLTRDVTALAWDQVEPGQLIALLGGGALAAAIGYFDDRLQLRARWQFIGQLAVAGVAVAFGLRVLLVANPFDAGNGIGSSTIPIAGPFAIAFTIVWIIGMINSINFIDGLDGLSSGIGIIAAVTLGVISLTGTSHQPYVALLCFALAGALLGFLRWNFHPASIFIGTSGVMVLGYSLAVLSILGTAKVAVALLILAVPIIDTFWIIVRRVGSGHSPFTPDRGHIHHRLLDLGLSQTQTVLVIYGICTGLGVLAFLLSGTGPLYAFLGLLILFGVLIFLLTRRTLSDDDDPGEPMPAAHPRRRRDD